MKSPFLFFYYIVEIFLFQAFSEMAEFIKSDCKAAGKTVKWDQRDGKFRKRELPDPEGRMKFLMNFTTSYDDVQRYASSEDLKGFYEQYGVCGLEIMPLPYMDGAVSMGPEVCPLVKPDMVVGVHTCSIADWMDLDRTFLLDGIRYGKKGLMLDTGHYMHTDPGLSSPEEALRSLHDMLDVHGDLVSCIRGIHLHQSLTGAYVQNWLKNPPPFPEDPQEQFCRGYEHIFAIDRHEPFTAPGIRLLVERIRPLYVTYEYITRGREEHAEYLTAGRLPFLPG